MAYIIERKKLTLTSHLFMAPSAWPVKIDLSNGPQTAQVILFVAQFITMKGLSFAVQKVCLITRQIRKTSKNQSGNNQQVVFGKHNASYTSMIHTFQFFSHWVKIENQTRNKSSSKKISSTFVTFLLLLSTLYIDVIFSIGSSFELHDPKRHSRTRNNPTPHKYR